MSTASLTTALGANEAIRTCPVCGLAQVVPPVPRKKRAVCPRCRSTILHPVAKLNSHSRTAAIALAALIIYPMAVTLPILEITRWGGVRESSIIDGVATLLADGEIFVGVVVLLCSIVLPIAKLLGLLILSAGGMLMHYRHRAWTYRFINWTGRWGMLDVLAVAVVVAAVKLGHEIELTAGPGAAAFATVVILSLIASAVFDPHAIWYEEDKPREPAPEPAR